MSADGSDFRLKPRAIADLDEIWDYTAETWSEAQADAYVAGLFVDFEMLAEQPMLGRARKDLAPELRAWIYSRHVVYYIPADPGVVIVRVLHVSRDVDPVSEF